MGEYGRKSWKLDESANIPALRFNLTEVLSLYLARRFLEPLAGTNVWIGAQSAFKKIRATLGESAIEYLDKLAHVFQQTPLAAGDYSKHAELIERLLIAIEDRKIAWVVYHSARATEPVSTEVYPLVLLWHQGSLYLLAHAREDDKVKTYKLDRISDVDVTSLVFNLPEDFDARQYLNEFTYCPRLAYLEWVQGEFTDNLDTKQGTFGHRNVDKPSARPVPAGDECGEASDDGEEDAAPIKTRSLTLSAPREGLLAKLDVLELEGSVATPVEYKKGSIPNNPEQAWELERVQLCAQGLILCENGYTCEQGELYYIESRHRVVIPFDDALVMRTRELVKRLREMAQSEQMPPPLIDSPKCPRCSLVGICLPDETNLLCHDDLVQLDTTSDPLAARNRFNAPTPAVRRLIPARDDALPLYVKEQGASVGKDGDRIVVRPREGKPVSLPLMDVSQVSLFGNVQISAQALREVVDRGIPVCHFSYGGWFHAMTTGHVHKNIELRMAQFATAADPAKSLPLAKGFITAKIKNSRTMLRRHADEKHQRDLDQLAEWVQKAERAESAETLLGLEGMAAKIYFAGFARLLNGDDAFDLSGRNRRPPRDPVNALLSFVYSLLTKELAIAAQAVGFDPLLGFFHRPRYGRPSLALDLAEEFRPIIADSTVMMLINNGEVAAPSFLARAGSVALTESGRKAVIAAFERRMEQEITHPIFGYKISYRRVLEVQARLLSRVLLGELTEYPGFCTR